ncbi:MAG: hypothetical protein J7621_25660 [Niastella sp.]|nr:hypothetical protein [Niastella sp.]
MSKIRNFLLLLYITVVIYACSTARSNVKNINDVEKLPDTSPQVETRLIDVDLPMPQLMTIYRDSLLLVMNNLNRNPHHVRVFDIVRKKAVNNILPASRRKGGTMAFMSFGISDSLVWVFDVGKNGFIVANIDTVLKSNAGVEYYSEYRITPQVFYYDAMLLNRNEALLSGNYDTDEKLVYINFLDSTRNKQLLSYQQDSNIGSARVNKMSYESFMLLKPDKKKLLLAGRYSDQLELFDLDNVKYMKIKGPVGFLPKLAPFENNAGVTEATPGRDTRYGFLKGHVTARYCYLLFSGYSFQSFHQFYGNRIWVYDWEGNPVKEINLKNDIVDFSVSSDDKILYTLNPQTKVISSSALKW